MRFLVFFNVILESLKISLNILVNGAIWSIVWVFVFHEWSFAHVLALGIIRFAFFDFLKELLKTIRCKDEVKKGA